MSKLMNYRPSSSKPPIANYNKVSQAKNDQGYQMPHQFADLNLDKTALEQTFNQQEHGRPPSGKPKADDKQIGYHNNWGMSSVNSEITREIDNLLHQQQQFDIRKPAANQRPFSSKKTDNNNSTTFNLAAKGVLQSNNHANFTLNEQNPMAQAVNINSFPDIEVPDPKRGTLGQSFQSKLDTNYMLGNEDLSKKRIDMGTYNQGTQQTLDLELIERKNDERLNKLKQLGLGTVNEETRKPKI